MISHFHFSQNLDFHPFSSHEIPNVCAWECFNIDHKLLRLDYILKPWSVLGRELSEQSSCFTSTVSKVLSPETTFKIQIGCLTLVIPALERQKQMDPWYSLANWFNTVDQFQARGTERDKYRWMVLLQGQPRLSSSFHIHAHTHKYMYPHAYTHIHAHMCAHPHKLCFFNFRIYIELFYSYIFTFSIFLF